jgi:hypothetical protein
LNSGAVSWKRSPLNENPRRKNAPALENGKSGTIAGKNQCREPFIQLFRPEITKNSLNEIRSGSDSPAHPIAGELTLALTIRALALCQQKGIKKNNNNSTFLISS